MIRASGLTEVSREQLDLGQAHDFKIHSAIPYEVVATDVQNTERMTNVLQSGKAIVSEPHLEVVRQAMRAEIFPDKIVEEDRSAHRVAFGRVIGRRPQKRSGQGHIMTVAIKPFGDTDGAISEIKGYWALQDVGVETYDPVGIFPLSSMAGFAVVTQKRNDFQSLDRDEWVVGRQVYDEESEDTVQRNARTIKEIAEITAWINANGIFHPDGQIKNYAVTDYGQLGIIDTENLTVLPLGHPDTVGLVVDNIEKLMKSLIDTSSDDKIFGVGFFAGLSEGRLQESFEELVLNPYIDKLMSLYEDGQIDASQAELLIDGLTSHYMINKTSGWPKVLVA